MSIFIRSKLNPVLKPSPKNKWENFKLYNPGAIYHDNKYHLFYRAVGKDKNINSSIGYAISSDGYNFIRFNKPLLNPSLDIESKGLEDPRVSKVGKTFYMSYAAYDGNSPHLAIATSNDLKKWKKHGKALSGFIFCDYGATRTLWKNKRPISAGKETKEWSKSGAIFPSKIKKKYWMLFGEHYIWMAHSNDGIKWKFNQKIFLKSRTGSYFDNCYVETGSPPIKTSRGWLVLYHGINKSATYSIGYLLLDINNPLKILYRSRKPIFKPTAEYEKFGAVDLLGLNKLKNMNNKDRIKFLKKTKKHKWMPRVVFCCGAIKQKGNLRIYYGAGDSIVCTASAKIDDILNSL